MILCRPLYALSQLVAFLDRRRAAEGEETLSRVARQGGIGGGFKRGGGRVWYLTGFVALVCPFPRFLVIPPFTSPNFFSVVSLFFPPS